MSRTPGAVARAATAAATVCAMATIAMPFGAALQHAAAATTPRTASPSCGWSISARPHAGRTNVLYGVSAVSANDVWAVGWRVEDLREVPLAYHWDGSTWTRVLAAGRPGSRDMFSSVVALASNDVWAVGESIDGSLNETTLTEHWDGSSWTVVDSPNPDPRRDIFVDVSAIPGTDRLWAVGGAGDNTLVELWTGSKWKVVSSPSGGSGSFFNGVSAAASGDAWATGGTGDDQYLTARWNGVAWNFAQQPPFGSRIAAFADGTALAAGHRFARWDGSAWLPLGRAHGRTSDIAATPQQGWAVGTTGPIGMTRTWSARWDGSAWKTTSSPNAPGEDADVLFSVAQTPGSTEAWAVGFAYHVWHHNNFDRPLILHHC